METDKNYVVVGGFVLGLLIATLLFGAWLIGPHDKSKYVPYRIHFSESVSGLSVGGVVKFRGVDVGKVDTIAIDQVDTRRIEVDVSILKGTPIKTDTVASLKLQGITGAVFVELTGSTPQAPDLISRKDDDSPPEIPAQTSSIDAIVNILPEILQKVSRISDQISKLFSDDNLTALHTTITGFGNVATALQEQTGALDQLLRNSNAVATDVHGMLENSKGDIRSVTENLNHTSQQLDALIAGTNATAGGQYQQFYQLLTQLKATSRDISKLAKSVEEDPSRLILPPKQQGVPAP